MATVLIVDDSATQNACLEILLLNIGCRVELARSMSEARAVCERVQVELSMVELMLFKDNGFEIAPDLQTITGAPVALMLSRRLEADVIWARAQGIENFIYRPCEQQSCERFVGRLLQHC